MSALVPAEPEPDPIETDELCELCGCAIEDLEAVIYLRAAELVEQWERADSRDAWRHTGEPPPRVGKARGDNSPPERIGQDGKSYSIRQQPYSTPQSTIDAFLYVVRNHDADYVAKWLANHPRDVETLTKLWEAKNGVS